MAQVTSHAMGGWVVVHPLFLRFFRMAPGAHGIQNRKEKAAPDEMLTDRQGKCLHPMDCSTVAPSSAFLHSPALMDRDRQSTVRRRRTEKISTASDYRDNSKSSVRVCLEGFWVRS